MKNLNLQEIAQVSGGANQFSISKLVVGAEVGCVLGYAAYLLNKTTLVNSSLIGAALGLSAVALYQAGNYADQTLNLS